MDDQNRELLAKAIAYHVGEAVKRGMMESNAQTIELLKDIHREVSNSRSEASIRARPESQRYWGQP